MVKYIFYYTLLMLLNIKTQTTNKKNIVFFDRAILCFVSMFKIHNRIEYLVFFF